MSAIYVVKVEVDPAYEEAWSNWHTHHHIPEVLSAHRGFVRARKYKVNNPEDSWSQYLVMYEIDSHESLNEYLNGEEVIRLRADHYTHFGHCTRLSRLVLTPTAVVNKPTS